MWTPPVRIGTPWTISPSGAETPQLTASPRMPPAAFMWLEQPMGTASCATAQTAARIGSSETIFFTPRKPITMPSTRSLLTIKARCLLAELLEDTGTDTGSSAGALTRALPGKQWTIIGGLGNPPNQE